ncbi:hypothetical protein [Pseudoalteromonas sp. MMG007]|uniref:hypothetical protein n=1 Tax=Pseudoalteromonas sp. MMG007 TaxID=2822684 RepID=UPI001B389082|nr:hypothetical protein [Pseudoalteromonas sp. MMG007]MBQ4859880.1 hypothetical protein [Pseudoalteromonas sp. MMG007]
MSLGQHVDLRFSTFKNADKLIIDGTVENISADRLENERAERQYYLVRISVKPESQHLLTKNGLKLLPGMPAEVHIKTGTQTLMAYLLQPMKKCSLDQWLSNSSCLSLKRLNLAANLGNFISLL